MEELMQWYNQISSLPKLKITEAQELYRKAANTQDETLKKEYMDELVLGTLYVVYEYIKRNGLELLVSSSYDMNDIISSFNSAWIKKVYDGELLNVDRYSFLFRSPYFNEVYSNLCGDEIIVSEQFGISTDCLIDLITLYISYKNKGLDKPFREIIRETFFTDKWKGYMFHNVMKTIPLIEKIYENLNFDKSDDLDMRRTKIAEYLRLMINMGMTEPISNKLQDENNMEETVTSDIVMEQFIGAVDKALNDKQRSIIHERFGLDNGKPQFLETIGKHHGVARERVRQIEATAIRKLYRNENIRKYEGKNM